ncbi:MAG: outer membrane beta-barrel protein [Burkholderiales bacterium]
MRSTKATLLAFLCFAPPAWAEHGTGLYIGGGAGWANHGSDCDFGSVVASHCDTNSVGTKAFVGFDLAEHFSLEAGYYGLGETRANPGGNSFKFEPIGVALQGVVQLRLNDHVVVQPKIGAFFWDIDTTVNGTKFNDTGTSLVFGVGAEIGLARNLTLRVDAEFFPNLGDEFTVGESDVSLVSTSLVLRF